MTYPFARPRLRPYLYKENDDGYFGIGFGVTYGYRLWAVYLDVGWWRFEVGLRR